MMKTSFPTKNSAGRLMAAMLTSLAVVTATSAAPLPLTGRIDLRPISPSDLKDYGLTGQQGASGLSTVPVGEPAYLDAEVNIAIPASDVTNVSWSLVSKPFGSSAALVASPLLATNIPIFKPSDQLVYQIVGRMMLRPDVRGQYAVSVTIETASEGTTNIVQNITGGIYLGVYTCGLCHSGSKEAPDMVDAWSQTLHASKFTRGIDGEIAGYGKNCISCHTVGYDTSPHPYNGGFTDVAATNHPAGSTNLWTFPTVLTNNPSNWASMQANYPALANLANIQCENCHGPGSEHAGSVEGGFGNTNYISVSFNAGDCGQCHDSKTHHVKVPEWKNSKHAISTTHPAGNATCVGCHTAMGFEQRMEATATGITSYVTNTAYEAITCAACHDPHDASNPHQLRNTGPVTLMDGTVVTNYGTAELCMNCHHSRQNATNYVEVTSGSAYFGPHEGPQSDMFLGVNGVTYGNTIPSSAHRDSVTNACVTCHMQPAPASTDPEFLLVGDHTFKNSDENSGYDQVATCQQCHGGIKTFNFPREDYDGNGVIEGVQTEVQNLLNNLATLLPPTGTPKSDINITSSWTRQQLRAAYNYRFVQKDGSMGVHNVAYAVGLLKASIADLTGGAGAGGIPASWQIQYFGSTTNPAASPYADPTGDGVPNWLKYSLGLDPNVGGMVLTNGVIFGNVTAIGGETNTVHIYTAAEIAFDTEVGKTYQIQSISALSGGVWSNVGDPIPGSGNAISYLTPMRDNVQQYFRVVHTP